ncbi:hypothetical protein C0Q70_16915 [Pomacea canaliculata]|uniref:Uncharacterized protein n=1 Tax=Pomacea canaliculata TaxID=400727 RepID=A0A2T7NR65_POMCA|nr:hypothetical protein C0Q70_16915 [Pomacea canaliculata]
MHFSVSSIIYDPKSSTNEKDSIEVFKQFSAETSIAPELSDRVVQLITATITHQTDNNLQDTDMDFFLDFDMAVLGQPEKEYRAYAGAIRKEYSHVEDRLYSSGRAQVLQTFLERPNIFATLPFREMFEAQARENLKQEIEDLRLPALS